MVVPTLRAQTHLGPRLLDTPYPSLNNPGYRAVLVLGPQAVRHELAVTEARRDGNICTGVAGIHRPRFFEFSSLAQESAATHLSW